mgnify:FL=1
MDGHPVCRRPFKLTETRIFEGITKPTCLGLIFHTCKQCDHPDNPRECLTYQLYSPSDFSDNGSSERIA